LYLSSSFLCAVKFLYISSLNCISTSSHHSWSQHWKLSFVVWYAI
jgi:hypothetical protein